MSYKWHILNEGHSDVVSYLFHLKHLKNISYRHNQYFTPRAQSKGALNKKQRVDEAKRVETEIRSNLRSIGSNNNLQRSQILHSVCVGKSSDYKRELELYRRIEEEKLIKANEHLIKQLQYHKNTSRNQRVIFRYPNKKTAKSISYLPSIK